MVICVATYYKIKNLVEGESYILHEEVSIEGYVKATDVEFKVTNDKETQKLVMIDKSFLIHINHCR